MQKSDANICICQKKAVLLHRELNEGTRKVSSLYEKLWISNSYNLGLTSI